MALLSCAPEPELVLKGDDAHCFFLWPNQITALSPTARAMSAPVSLRSLSTLTAATLEPSELHFRHLRAPQVTSSSSSRSRWAVEPLDRCWVDLASIFERAQRAIFAAMIHIDAAAAGAAPRPHLYLLLSNLPYPSLAQ